MNCAEMEAYNPNYIGGDVIGGITDWRQLFTRPVGMFSPYATPNPKIFLCSASTPPGGGVHGMCGYWAAESVVKRVR
jgi:phytoene dehydrogenase-like protein